MPEWELVQSVDSWITTYRLPVDGGWIYRIVPTSGTSCCVFVAAVETPPPSP